MYKIYEKIIAFIFIIVTVFSAPAGLVAQYPDLLVKTAEAATSNFNKQVNYQGKLMTNANIAVADGVYNMRFGLYTTATGGAPVWNEDRSAAVGDRVTISNGLFSVMLGSSTSLSNVDFNQTLYLGVEIGGSAGVPTWDGEMTPRKILGTVPSAFVADKLDGLDSTQFVRTDATSTIVANSADTLLTLNQQGAGDILSVEANGVSALSIINNGNVGIGNTAP